MRMNTLTEKTLAIYVPKIKIRMASSSKVKGSTLEEFYQEVTTHCELQNKHFYSDKNAKEIESIMIQNRQLIETKLSLKNK